MANNFLRQLFGGTEPSYAGLRVPRQMMQDDSRLIRLGNPQERFRDYHSPDMFDRTKSPIGSDVLGLAPLSEEDKVDIQGGMMEAPLVETPEQKAKAKKAQQDMIRGIGSDLASMFAQSQEPSKPLQFAQLQQQQLIPLIDPRFRRAKGGKVKKGQPYLVGEEGVEVVVPEEDGVVLPNPSTVDEEARKFGGNRANFAPQEEVTETQVETPTTDAETFTETPEPSIADLLRSKIDERQKRLAEGATKNPDGTTTYGGQKYRKRNALDALKSAGLGALQSLANMQVNPNDPNPLSSMFGRAIGGAGAGAVMGATMNNVDERMMDKMKLAQLLPQYEQAYGQERQKKADDLAEKTKIAQIRNLDEDNANARWGRNIQERGLIQQEKNRISREQTSRMTQVAGLLKNTPEFIPGDPKFKELEQALGDVKLPVFQKDAKKKVDLRQDQRTGAWTVILTNPVTKEVESRPVPDKDGKQLRTTPTVVMQGELGLLKQNDQQAFMEQQNTLDRNLRVELQNSVQSFGREQTLQKATDAYKQLYFKTNGKNPTQAEIDAYITNTVTPMLEVGMNPIP